MSEPGELQEADAAAIASLATTDPARRLIAEILRVVAVSHWSFARFANAGPSDQLLLPQGGDGRRHEFEHLRQELVLQRESTARGPHLGPTLTAFEKPYVSGITLVFADMRREFGILSLLRTAELGPFTSIEIQALALALDSSADRLCGLTLAEGSPDAVPINIFDQPAMHVLDRELRVVLTWHVQKGRIGATKDVHAHLAHRLPPAIEVPVRALVDTWTADPATQAIGVAHPVPFLTVRTQPLVGPMGLFVGVLLERPPGGQVFNKAARAFNLSPRELETFSLLLKGATLNEVAGTMHITSSTVQDHITSMLKKTASRNRSELIGKLLSPR